ncbi:WSC-domain-containing protein [Tothia fuscella]|uniref:WSC-domain-containing protein n=1 Tax=Tothia fuscella TaxID=1048955 RepID=A0A9P4U0C7_9PEZI|nr:WSC-domain-containing protein [Tothia fuscella]
MLPTTMFASLMAFLASPAAAYIRFNCANHAVEERADPIVNPGAVAGHAHKIAGGNGFGFTMDYEQARASKCSSCPIKQDLSNYWTPKLYFQGGDGTFTSVPTVGDNAADLNGGMTVYYQQRGPAAASKTLKAFPRDFRMLAGDPFKRNFTGDFPAQAINFACLGAGKPETNSLPDYNCPGGLRAQIYFPSCWDGKNYDSDNHRSHMSYPASGAHDNGPCPKTHPVQLISLFYEVLYDTNSFASKWPTSSKNPFVFANGDATGYGFHGDFVNGWDIDTLQAVTDTCTNDAAFGSTEKKDCPPIDKFTDDQQNACKIPPQIDEVVAGQLKALPGCNPVTHGPEPASKNPSCDGQTTGAITTAATYYTDITITKGWSYVGCGSDGGSPRTLGDKSTQYMSGVSMTVEYCVDFCSGYKYAGLEYGTQCWCGNTLPTDRAPQAGILGNCQMNCQGDDGEYCGGSWALSIYKKCDSTSSCQNAQYGTVGNGTTKA